MSQVNPCSSLNDRASPPGVDSASNRHHSRCPSDTRCLAAPKPVGPAPMTRMGMDCIVMQILQSCGGETILHSEKTTVEGLLLVSVLALANSREGGAGSLFGASVS